MYGDVLTPVVTGKTKRSRGFIEAPSSRHTFTLVARLSAHIGREQVESGVAGKNRVVGDKRIRSVGTRDPLVGRVRDGAGCVKFVEKERFVSGSPSAPTILTAKGDICQA